MSIRSRQGTKCGMSISKHNFGEFSILKPGVGAGTARVASRLSIQGGECKQDLSDRVV